MREQKEVVFLQNGLRLIWQRLENRHGVSVNVRVNAGARYENDDQAGLAHLVEHLLFQGTKRWPSSYDLTSQVEALGGELNGATHTEYSSYWLDTPRNYFAQSIPVFLDILQNPLFDPQTFKNEKKVILDEIAEANEAGWYVAQNLLDKNLWRNHPLGRNVIGNERSLHALQLSDVQAYFRRYYTPDRMVAAVVGDLSLEEAVTPFDQAWDGFTPSSADEKASAPEKLTATLMHTHQEDGTLHMMIGFKIPSLNHPDFNAYTLLWTLLGEGMSSRLYQALRGEAGLCYSLENYMDEVRHACVLITYIALQPENMIEVFNKVCDIFYRVKTEGFSEEELEKGRRQAIGKLLLASDRAKLHAMWLSLSMLLTGDILSIPRQIAQLEKVTLADLCRAADKVLYPENMYVSMVGPVTDQMRQRCQSIINNWR